MDATLLWCFWYAGTRRNGCFYLSMYRLNWLAPWSPLVPGSIPVPALHQIRAIIAILRILPLDGMLAARCPLGNSGKAPRKPFKQPKPNSRQIPAPLGYRVQSVKTRITWVVQPFMANKKVVRAKIGGRIVPLHCTYPFKYIVC